MTASAAARRISSGPGSSGKPWPRLIALLSRASCDIASKIVTGRSAKTLFVEIIGAISRRSWSAIRRPSRPAFRPRDACRKPSRRLAMGIGDILRIETRKRNDHRARIRLHGNLIRFADIDEKIAPLGHSLRYVLRRQIVNSMTLIRHSNPPSDDLIASVRQQRNRQLALACQRRPWRDENQAVEASERPEEASSWSR